MASDMSKNKYYKTRSGGKTQMKNGGGSPKFKAAAATALLYSSSTAATRATPWWRRSTSATRPDPPTRCYIKTCQLQRRFISHSIDSSLPYFNRPIVHQERSDSLVYFFANKIAPPSIIYIQRGLTKFLWFFNCFFGLKRNKFQRRYDWKRGEHIFCLLKKAFFVLLYLRSMKTFSTYVIKASEPFFFFNMEANFDSRLFF